MQHNQFFVDQGDAFDAGVIAGIRLGARNTPTTIFLLKSMSGAMLAAPASAVQSSRHAAWSLMTSWWGVAMPEWSVRSIVPKARSARTIRLNSTGASIRGSTTTCIGWLITGRQTALWLRSRSTYSATSLPSRETIWATWMDLHESGASPPKTPSSIVCVKSTAGIFHSRVLKESQAGHIQPVLRIRHAKPSLSQTRLLHRTVEDCRSFVFSTGKQGRGIRSRATPGIFILTYKMTACHSM